MIKEATSSTFVFHGSGETQWKLALIWHPRLDCWMPPGGHVEPNENPAEAAEREVLEETGLVVRMIDRPTIELPTEFPHSVLTAPWWVAEVPAMPDNHTHAAHVHVDHVFLAIAQSTETVRQPAHAVRWFSEREVAEDPSIIADSRIQAKELFVHSESWLVHGDRR